MYNDFFLKPNTTVTDPRHLFCMQIGDGEEYFWPKDVYDFFFF
jgi:hypothetical protein